MNENAARIILFVLFGHAALAFAFAFYWQAKFIFRWIGYTAHYLDQRLSRKEAEVIAWEYMISEPDPEKQRRKWLFSLCWVGFAAALIIGFFVVNSRLCFMEVISNGEPICVVSKDGSIAPEKSLK